MNIKPIWLAVAILAVVIIFVTGTIKYINRGNELEASENQVKQFQTEIPNLKQKVEDRDKIIGDKDKEIGDLKKQIAIMEPRSNIEGITAAIDEGLWHDVDFLNESGKVAKPYMK